MLFKAGALQHLGSARFLFFQPLVTAGLACYGISAFFYVTALKHIPLSIAYSSLSLSYIVVAIAGHLIWKEAFGIFQIGGIAFIILGVSLLFRGM